MRNQFISLVGVLLLAASLSACKKADAPATSAASSDAAPQVSKTAAVKDKDAAKGETTVLKVKWPVGNRYVYRMDLDQHSTNKLPMMPKPIEQNVTMAMTYSLSVMKEVANAAREIEMEFLANEMEVKMGDQVMMSFDSKESGKTDPQNAAMAPFRKMIGSKLHIQVNADGKVDKVLDLDQWQKNMIGDQPGPGAGMLSQQFGEGFFQQILDYGRAFPDKGVKPGDSWPFKADVPAGPMGKIAVDSMITFKGMQNRQEHSTAALDMKGTFKALEGIEAGPMGKMSLENGKAVGTSWFDPELGALVESVSDQTMRLKGNMPGQPGGARPPVDFTIDLGQKVSLNLVELGKVK